MTRILLPELVLIFVLLLGTHNVCSAVPALHGRGREHLICDYFKEGYEYKLILCFLHFVHGVCLSLRQLKRVLKQLNLRRRPPANSQQVTELLKNELRGTASLLGYRAMWRRLNQKYGIPISRDMVMRTLRNIDPEDSFQRRQHRLRRRKYRNKGPNYVWHCDGYDKLKPYGFAVHACIDGYSRRILWLTVGVSNNNPAVVAWHYLNCIKELQGTPRILRTDCGTENTRLAFIQPFLRRDHPDCFAGSDSFRYGGSISNQRIEAWWGQLRRWNAQWWIELFQDMQHHGLFDETNVIHVDCLKFCFLHIIQNELDRVAHEWNTHKITPGRQSAAPGGSPDELYFIPQILGTQDYLCSLNLHDLAEAEKYVECPDLPASLEFLEMVNILFQDHQLQLVFPHTISEALDLYVQLVAIIEAEID